MSDTLTLVFVLPFRDLGQNDLVSVPDLTGVTTGISVLIL